MKKKTEFGYLYARLDRAIKNTSYCRDDITRLRLSISKLEARLLALEQSSEPGNSSDVEND